MTAHATDGHARLRHRPRASSSTRAPPSTNDTADDAGTVISRAHAPDQGVRSRHRPGYTP